MYESSPPKFNAISSESGVIGDIVHALLNQKLWSPIGYATPGRITGIYSGIILADRFPSPPVRDTSRGSQTAMRRHKAAKPSKPPRECLSVSRQEVTKRGSRNPIVSYIARRGRNHQG